MSPDDADVTGDTSVATPGDAERDSDYQLPPSSGAPTGDTPPAGKKKGPGRPRGSKNKTTPNAGDRPPSEAADFRRLRKQLTAILKGPGFVFEGIGEKWPAEHIDRTAPDLADAIVDQAKVNPALKARLEAFLEGGATAQLIIAAVMYIAPIGIYFGVIPAPDRLKTLLQIPDRTPGIGPGPDVPLEVREQVEREAVEKGFVDAFGNADLDAYQAAIMDAANRVQGPGQNGGG